MKTPSLSLIAFSTLCLLAAACTSMTKDRTSLSGQVKLSSSTIYASEDEQVLQLKIVTENRQQLRIQGPHFSVYANTAPEEGKKKPCSATFWFIGSSITYDNRTFTRILLQGRGNTSTCIWEYPKGTQLTNILNLALPNSPMMHPLNHELSIGTYNLEDMRLLVGPAVYPMKKAQTK